MNVKRLGKVLRSGAEDQVEESRIKLESCRDLYSCLLSELLVTEFSHSSAYDTAQEIFGSSRVRFGAVDGSQDQQLVAGLAVFWAGSYAATGTVEFREDGPPHVEYETGFIERGQGISSCIPIYVDRVHEVDLMVKASSSGVLPGVMTVTDSLTEQAVVDNSTISSWVMTFSELFLAYKLIVEGDVRILLLDRSLSATHTALMYDTSRRSHWKSDGVICGFEVDGVPIDINEMGYGRHYIINPALRIPPARGDYIRYATIFLLQTRTEPMRLEEICRELGVDTEDRKRRVQKYLERSVEEGYLNEAGGKYSINPRYVKTWERIK